MRIIALIVMTLFVASASLADEKEHDQETHKHETPVADEKGHEHETHEHDDETPAADEEDHDNGAHEHDDEAPPVEEEHGHETPAADEEDHDNGAHKHDDEAPPVEEEHGHESSEEDHGTSLVQLTAVERENIGLKTVPAVTQPLEDTHRLPGVIKAHPDRVALVTSRSPGKVVAIHAKIGDRVTRGQDLIDVQSLEVARLTIDLIQAESRYQTELSKLELDLAQAENRLRPAQAEADRFRALVEKGIGARKDLIVAESQLQAIHYEIDGAKRQMELLAQVSQNEIEGVTLQLRLLGLTVESIVLLKGEQGMTLLHIPAPIDGVVVERPVILGQIIDTNTTLFKIIDDSTVIAEGDAFEDVLASLQVGQRVRVTTEAYPKRVFEATLTFIHPAIHPEKRTVTVWAEFANPDGALKPDMFARLNVVVGGGDSVVTVPVASVITADSEEFVFVERGAGFARVGVVTGVRNDEFVEIKRGLKEGDRVVTEGKRQVYTIFLEIRTGRDAVGGHQHL